MDAGEYRDGQIRGRLFVAGVSGSGKSRLVESLVVGSGRVAIFDRNGNFWGRESCPPGFTVFRDTRSFAAALREHLRLPFKFIYQPITGDLEAQFEVVTYLVYKCGWCVYWVDEFNEFCSASTFSKLSEKQMLALLPRGQRKGGLYEIANYSRHHHMAFVGTTRRPAEVARGITSQMTEIRIFSMHEQTDVDYFARILGSSHAERLRVLGRYEYLRFYPQEKNEPELLGGYEKKLDSNGTP